MASLGGCPLAESRVKKWSVFHTTNFRSRPGEIEAMPARKASPHRFSARRAIESPPLQLHPKTVSQLCRWEHIFCLPQLEWLGAFQLAHGSMHFPCANLIAEQTVPLARSNAFHRLQNGAELILRTAGSAYFLQPFVSSSATHPLPSSLNPSPAPQTLGIICSFNSPIDLARNRAALQRHGGVKRTTVVTVTSITS